jgi:hypothetical protein
MSTKCETKPTRRHRDSTRSKVQGTHAQRARTSTTQTLAGTGYGPRHTGMPARKQVFMGFRNSPQLSMSTECIAPHTRRGGDSTRQQVQGTHAPMARASMCRARAHAVCGFGSTFGFAWQGKKKANNAQPPCQRRRSKRVLLCFIKPILDFLFFLPLSSSPQILTWVLVFGWGVTGSSRRSQD